MPQRIDDFTIVLPELTDMVTCELETYDGLDRLWRMVERRKMTAPIAIRVVDNKARCVRAFRGDRHPTTGWQLEEESPSVKAPFGDEVEFPLTINTQDTKGNILKMRLELAVEPEPDSALSLPSSDKRGTANNHEAIATEGSNGVPHDRKTATT